MSDKKTTLDEACACGSGKKAGECCYGNNYARAVPASEPIRVVTRQRNNR